MALGSYSAPRIWISHAEYEYAPEYVYIRQTLAPNRSLAAVSRNSSSLGDPRAGGAETQAEAFSDRLSVARHTSGSIRRNSITKVLMRPYFKTIRGTSSYQNYGMVDPAMVRDARIDVL
jgi:hypothetical protein